MTPKTIFPTTSLLTVLAWCFVLFGFGVSYAQAVTPSVTLTVNNGASTAILNGQPVELDWYAVGVQNCVINNGVGAIPNEELPSGSRTVIPPENLQTTYTMTCETIGASTESSSDSSTVLLSPVVNFSSKQGNTVTTNPLTGTAVIELEWTSQYATECSNITWKRASGSTGAASNASNKFPDQYKISGLLKFDGWPNYPITETTTYSITCTNSATGLITTKTLTVEVQNAPPAPDPTVTLTSAKTTIDASPTLGYGYASLNLNAQNVNWCTYKAFDLNGNAITVNGFTNRWGGNGFVATIYAEMATSTRFDVECSRTTDTKKASTTITILMNPLATALPNPTLSFSVTPATVYLDNLNGEASVNFSYTATAVNFCPVRKAIEPDGDSEDFYHWGGDLNRSGKYTISTTTTFVVECKRNFDGATVRATTTVTALPATTTAPAPTLQVWATDMSGNPVTNVPLVGGFASIKVYWESENTTYCDYRKAINPNGSTYSFSSSDDESGVANRDISTTTRFFVRCGRDADTQIVQQEITVAVAPSLPTTISDEAVVDAGECIDASGTSIDTPPGFMPSPTDGTCVPIPTPSTVDLDVNISGQDIPEDADSSVTIGAGDTINLSWASTDAYECLSSSGAGFNVGGLTSGSDVVTEPNIGNAIVYTIQCRGYGGDSSDSVEIRRPALDVEVTVSKTTVNQGELVDVSWNLNGNDPTACVLSGPGLPGANTNGELALTAQSGSLTGIAISGESNYTLRCDSNTLLNGMPVNPGDTDVETVRVVGQAFDS